MTDAAFPADPARCAAAEAWFAELRDRICSAFEAIEDVAGEEAPSEGRLVASSDHAARAGGGGRSRSCAAVSKSRGQHFDRRRRILAEFRNDIPGPRDDRGSGRAASAIGPLRSPLVPAVQAPAIVTTKAWFGGGTDITPIYPDARRSTNFMPHSRRLPLRPRQLRPLQEW
jgi:coproporphyrinogen III oxidase